MATAKMPAPAAPARSRSMLDIDEDASPRVSTMTRSGGVDSRAARSSITLTGIASGAQQTAEVLLEGVVFRNDEADELSHGDYF